MLFEIVIVIIFFMAGFGFSRLLKPQLRSGDVRILSWLWVYHVFFAIVFFAYTLNDGSSDSISYWNRPRLMTSSEALFYLFNSKGTGVMYAINYFPSKVIGLSYFTGTIIYAFLGFIGVALYYILVVKTIPYNVKVKGYYLFPALLFMPNLHFWSGGIGKDTILFSCIAVFSYAILKVNKRIILLVLSLTISFFVRPHITLFLLTAFSLAYLFTSRIGSTRRIVLSLFLIAGGIIILPQVMEYANIEETSLENFNKFSNTKAANLSEEHTGTSIDISSYPLPLKIFTFLYRPLFFDINGLPAVLASFENLILLVLSVMVFRQRPIYAYKNAPLLIKGLVFFLIIGTLMFSNSLGNLGIMIRMRNMFLPALMLIILWSYSIKASTVLKRRNNLSNKNAFTVPELTAENEGFQK